MEDNVNKESQLAVNISQGSPGGNKWFTIGFLIIVGLLVYMAFFKQTPEQATLSAQYDKALRDSSKVWDARVKEREKNIARLQQYVATTTAKIDSLDSTATAIIIQSNRIILNMQSNKVAAKAYGEAIRNKSDSEQVQIFLNRSQ